MTAALRRHWPEYLVGFDRAVVVRDPDGHVVEVAQP
jgi:hypothetical protein